MGQSRIPVDLRNPGQVFACLGLMEVMESLGSAVCGGFENDNGQAKFVIKADKTYSPVGTALDFLTCAKVVAIAPSANEFKDKSGVTIDRLDEMVFPQAEPKTSILPVVLQGRDGASVSISHFSEAVSQTAIRDNCKFWGGAAGYSAAARTRDLISAFSQLDGELKRQAVNDPFNVPALISNGFRLEMRRDYVAIDVGFSPNEIRDMDIAGYPLVELFAAIGLEHARPRKISRLKYHYAVWMNMLPTSLARVVLGGSNAICEIKRFSMELQLVNRGGDRSICFVYEEL